MKKLLLFLGMGITSMSVNAQYSSHTAVIFADHDQNVVAAQPAKATNFPSPASHSTARTTAGTGGSRWYNYGDYFTNEVGGTTLVAFTSLPIWQDTAGLFYETTAPTWYNNTWTSVGVGFDPFVGNWNLNSSYPAVIHITPTNNYTIDSVVVFGNYYLGSHTSTDTLVLSFVQGNGSATGDLGGYYFNDATLGTDYGLPTGHDTISFINMAYDSTANRADSINAASNQALYKPTIYKFPLIPGVTDTSSAFINGYQYAVSYSVNAGNYAGMSVSFINGNHSFPAFPGTDTILDASGNLKYDEFYPAIIYYGTTTAAQFPPYNSNDHNVGYFKRQGAGDAGWDGFYLPNWAWTTGGSGTSASALQYPYTSFHVNCSTCYLTNLGVENTVKETTETTVYPNPASNEVAVVYNMPTASNITISLSNMIGQVVATQSAQNVTSGKIVFNTANLADGVYIYTIHSDGQVATGRVAVAH